MSRSLVERYTFGNSGWPSVYSVTRDAVFEHQSRGQQISHLASVQIQAQKAAFRDIAKSNVIGAQIVAAEIEQQTYALESAMEKMGNQIAGSISYAADQISDAIYDLGDRLCASLDEIKWELAQQNQTLEKILDVLKNSRNNEAQQLVKQGLRHYVNAEYEEAEKRFLKALDYDTTDYQLLMNLGYIEIHKGNSAAAHTFFKKALTLPDNLDSPPKARTLWAIARVHYADGEYEKAYTIAEHALQQYKSDDPKGVFTTAIYAALSGKNSIALSRIEKSISLNPTLFGTTAIEPDLEVIRQDILNLLSRISNDIYNKATKLSSQVDDEIQKAKSGYEVKNYSDLLDEFIKIKNKVDKILQHPSYLDCLKLLERLKNLKEAIKKIQSLDPLYIVKHNFAGTYKQKKKEYADLQYQYGTPKPFKDSGIDGANATVFVCMFIFLFIRRVFFGAALGIPMLILFISFFVIHSSIFIIYDKRYFKICSLYNNISNELRIAESNVTDNEDVIRNIRNKIDELLAIIKM